MGIPLVALQSQGPEIAKGIGDIGRRQLSLRKLLDEQKTAAQEQQMNQLKIQQAQQQQNEQAALQQAYQESGGDIDKLMQIAPARGVSPDTMIKLQNSVTAHKKSMLDLDNAQWTAIKNKNSLITSGLDSILTLPTEEAQSAAWPNVVKQLAQQGALSPEEAQQYAQYPGKDAVRQLDMQRKTSDQLNTQIDNERAAAAEKRKLEEFTTFGTETPTTEQKNFQGDYKRMLAATGQRPNAQLEMNYKKQWDAEQRAAKTTSEGTWSFAEDTQGKPVLFNSKTGATKPAPAGIQKTGTEKAERDYVIGIDSRGQEVMVPGGEADKFNLTQVGKAPTNQVVAAQDARQFKTLADKTGDPKKPETMGIKQLIDSLDKDGKLGVVASRMNSFLMGGVGTLPDDDPRIAALLNKSQLAMTLSMKAHFGLSGGRSPAMLQHFLDMANAKKMDGPALRAGFAAVDDYMSDRAMLPQVESAAPRVYKIGDPIIQNGEHYRVTKVDAQGKVLEAE